MYLRKRRCTEKKIETQVSKRHKHKREEEEEEKERRVKGVTICTNLASSSKLMKGYRPLLFYKINIFSLFLILGQSLLLLFVSLSYKFYWFGPMFNRATHCSKWTWAARFFLVLTIRFIMCFSHISHLWGRSRGSKSNPRHATWEDIVPSNYKPIG